MEGIVKIIWVLMIVATIFWIGSAIKDLGEPKEQKVWNIGRYNANDDLNYQPGMAPH